MDPKTETLEEATAALEAEVEALLGCYLEVQGWKALFGMLSRLAEKRSEGQIYGILKAAGNFLAEKG
jgi:hypothetical protein